MSVVEPVSPLGDTLLAGRYGAAGDGASGDGAVHIGERRCDVVQVLARLGRADAVVVALRAGFGVDLPQPGHAAVAATFVVLWIQPDAWLLVASRGPEGALARSVKAACGDAASVVDQTHGRCVISLSGERAAWVLGKLCRLDLHARAFGPGRAVVSPVAGLSCVVHQRDSAPSYDLVVFTTFARAFVASLTHAAEETGYIVA